jgi:PKD repeat protein
MIRMMCRAGLAALVVLSLAGCADDATGPDGPALDSELYAKGDGGKGGGGGGGGGKGELFSELLVILRTVDGVPIVIGPYETEHGTEYCVQPVTTNLQVPNPSYLLGDTGADQYLPTEVNPVDGRTVTLVPLFAHFPEFLPDPDDDDHGDDHGGGGGKGGKISPTHNPDDPAEGGEPCDPLYLADADYNYARFAVEAELERLNLGRTQDDVLARHLEEVILFINTANEVTLDAAGRFGFDWDDYDGEPILDAGPKLQAVRQELLETGILPRVPSQFNNPYFRLVAKHGAIDPENGRVVRDFDTWDTYELSAFALGGAASKFGSINPDIVAYHDRILNIVGDKTWEAWDPIHGDAGEAFVNYRNFRYDRTETFPGCVTYLHPYQHVYVVVPYLAAEVPVDGVWIPLFADLPPNAREGVLENIAGYAQMAEDARSVNYFTHMFSVLYMPVADPVGINTCAAQRAALPNGEPPTPNQPPTTSFEYDCNGLTCSFTDTSTDGDGTVVAWSWTFGDGGASAEQNPSHTYGNAGSYTVSLTVTDDEGATGFTSQVVPVEGVAPPPPGDGPIASFTYDCNNTATCRFADTSSGTGLKWSWTFVGGDPSQANSDLQNPIVTFQSDVASNPIITLVVTDESDLTDQAGPTQIECKWGGNQIRCR